MSRKMTYWRWHGLPSQARWNFRQDQVKWHGRLDLTGQHAGRDVMNVGHRSDYEATTVRTRKIHTSCCVHYFTICCVHHFTTFVSTIFIVFCEPFRQRVECIVLSLFVCTYHFSNFTDKEHFVVTGVGNKVLFVSLVTFVLQYYIAFLQWYRCPNTYLFRCHSTTKVLCVMWMTFSSQLYCFVICFWLLGSYTL